MSNAELMKLLKQVSQNNLQRKYLYAMGSVIVAAGIGIFVFYKKNKKISTDLATLAELNNHLTKRTNEQQAALLQKEGHIQELNDENQTLQNSLITMQTQSSIQEIKP